MQISTKMRYGSRTLAELARTHPDQTVSVRELAERQDISEKYLEHIMSALKSAGIVRSVRGKYGGYELARSPDSISLSEVYRVLEGTPAPVECVEQPESCCISETCPTRETWVAIRDAVEGVLQNTTIGDLADRSRQKTEAVAEMYHI
jgi:Rrf2 family protein